MTALLVPTLSPAATSRLQSLIAHARAQRHRYPLLICGNAEHNHAIAQQICAAFYTDALWIGADFPPAWTFATCTTTQVSQKLGQEFSVVVFDATHGLHVDALGITAGLIRAGGLLLLLAPPLAAWPVFDDPDYRRLMNAHEVSLSPRAFLTRLCNRFLPPHSIIHDELRGDGELRGDAVATQSSLHDDPVEAPYATAAQRDAVAALQRVVTGHRRRPLVLTADRGRGKSAAIGICCAQLLQAGKQSLVITAPSPAMVQAVLQHAKVVLPGSAIRGNDLWWQQRCLRFVAPDALLKIKEPVDAVFVDEAAAIPVPLLTALLQKYSRIAFISTINGYEGNGRGFALRFGDALKSIAPQHRVLHMSQPVRWNAADPLEQWVNALLCLDTAVDAANENTMPAARPVDKSSIQYREVSRDEWLGDEARLRQLFALLVLAHYQTTPSDLRWLLDAPGIRLFVACCGSELVGAAIGINEGAINEGAINDGGVDAGSIVEGDVEENLHLQIIAGQRRLHGSIIAGQRRLHGHLVAQRLAIDSGAAAWLNLRGLRISRIVVHPSWQRRKIGSSLLACVESAARDGCDYLSTSFGANAELLEFWCRAGFMPQRLGYTREQASGEHAVILVRPHNDTVRELADAARQRWSQAFLFALRAQFATLDVALVIALLQRCVCENSALPLDIAQRFARGELQLHESLWVLWPLVAAAATSPYFLTLAPDQQWLLVTLILQQQSLDAVRPRHGDGANGRLEHSLRLAVGDLIALRETTPD